MTTRIFNVKYYKPYNKYWTNPPTTPYVYIGGLIPHQIPFKPICRNIYKEGRDGTREVITKYKEWILDKPDLLKIQT